MSTKIASLWLLLLVISLVGCDQGTKHLAASTLRDGSPVQVISGLLDLRYIENRDTGFSLLRRVPLEIRRPLLVVTGSVFTVLLGLLLLRRRGALPERIALALLLAGGIGNVAERALRGYVIDFIHLRYWPVFNVADLCLVAGAALLLLLELRRWRAPPDRA